MNHLTIQQLVAHTDRELSGPSLKLVEKHITECSDCWQQMEHLVEQDALLAAVIALDPGEEFFEELAACVEREMSGHKEPAPRPVVGVAPAAPAPAPPARAAAPEWPPAPAPSTASNPPAPPPPAALPSGPAPAEPAAPASSPVAPAPDSRDLTAAFGAMQDVPALTGDLPRAQEPRPLAEDLKPLRLSDEIAPRAPEWEAMQTLLPTAPHPALPLAPGPSLPPAPRPSLPSAAAPRLRPVTAPARRSPAPPAVEARRAARDAAGTSPRRGTPAVVSFAVGAGAFIAALAVAIVVMMRLFGPGSTLFPRHSTPVMPVNETPETPNPAPTPVPADSASSRPAAVPPPAMSVVSEPMPAPAAPAPNTHRHPPASRTSDRAADSALSADPTVVVPVERIRTVTQSSGEPASTPAPAAPTATGSRPAILCGQVSDSDGHPIVRAQVMMADVGVVALTDPSGRFCLTAPAGQRTLSVAALGFTPLRRVVSMGRHTAELSITLKAAAPYPTAH